MKARIPSGYKDAPLGLIWGGGRLVRQSEARARMQGVSPRAVVEATAARALLAFIAGLITVVRASALAWR